MRFKFIAKPPLKRDIERGFLNFKKKFEAEIEFTQREGEKRALNLAKKAFKEGFERIIAIGGDGTTNEVLNGILKAAEEINQKFYKDPKKFFSHFAMGIIPGGFANDFAREIGIPKDPEKAFLNLIQGKRIFVDIGKVDQRYFANCLSFGFDAVINEKANEFKEKYPFIPKFSSYLLPAIKEIIKKIPNFDVEIKGEEIKLKEKVILVAITNTKRYGGIFKINPQADFSDGKLNLCLAKSIGKLKALYDVFLLSQGKHLHLPEIKTFEFKKPIFLCSPTPLPSQVDGEILKSKKEYLVEVFPKILPILVP